MPASWPQAMCRIITWHLRNAQAKARQKRPQRSAGHRPDSDLDLLVTVPDDWLAAYSRFMETDALGCKLGHHRIFSSLTAGLHDHVGSLLP